MKKLYFILSLAAITFSVGASAKVVMPEVFSDNMVLQQQTDAAIWGQAAPKSKVTITASWSNTPFTVKADKQGRWLTRIATPIAGGPYEVSISDPDGAITFKDVLIGEVWLCSGQSNMEEPVKGYDYQPVYGSTDAIMSAKPSTPIRMIEVLKNKSDAPLTECKTTSWLKHTPEAVANTSAVAYFFGSYMQKVIDVPVGLIVTDWGGTKIEAWMSKEALDGLDSNTAKYIDHDVETELYNAMVAPLEPFTVKGFIWYQGESNRNGQDAAYYTPLQTAYVQMMREHFGDGSAAQPFYYVQIAPFNYNMWGEVGYSAAYIREAQAACLKTIPNCGMATTVDVGDPGCIHPGTKTIIGQRLALLALQNTYGLKGIEANPGIFKSVEFEQDGTANVYFEMGGSTLCAVGLDLIGFELAGEDRIFHKATAQLNTDGPCIEVRCPEVPKPVAVRYCFDNASAGNVFNKAGIPVSPFRSDSW